MQQMLNELLNFKTISAECLSSKCKHKVTKKVLIACKAANNISFLKGHNIMSNQVSILVGQNRTVVRRFFLIIILSGSLF